MTQKSKQKYTLFMTQVIYILLFPVIQEFPSSSELEALPYMIYVPNMASSQGASACIYSINGGRVMGSWS